MRHLVILLVGACLALVAGACSSTRSAAADERPPNVVVVFVDDLGWGDLGCYGAPPLADGSSPTPHLDGLAASGTRLTRFYVSQPVCSASRASLLTGCYANRIGISGALGPGSRFGLDEAETTLAEVCASVGHRTACFGKWHLGHHPEFLPTRHGFERFVGIPYSNDMWPYHPQNPWAWPPLWWMEGEERCRVLHDQAHVTEQLTRHAETFVEECARDDERFFLYLAHPQPHVPLYAGAAFEGRTGRGRYADVVAELDASVGRVVAALEREGLRDDTLIVFASDNGPWLSYGEHAGSTGGLREGKGTTFEGGVRVPAIVSWPGRVPAGAVVDEPLMTIDVLPTVVRLVGAELGPLPIDGEDAWPVIAHGASNAERTYGFWYHANHLEAVMRGRHKLHLPHGYRSMVGGTPGAGGFEGAYDWGARTELALFDLVEDPGETRDLSKERPDVLAALLDEADALRAELGDRLTEVTGAASRAAGRLPEDRFVPIPDGSDGLVAAIAELRELADLDERRASFEVLWSSLVDRRRVPFVVDDQVLLFDRSDEGLGVDGLNAYLKPFPFVEMTWGVAHLPKDAARRYRYERGLFGQPEPDRWNHRSGAPWTDPGWSVAWGADYRPSRFSVRRSWVPRATRTEWIGMRRSGLGAPSTSIASERLHVGSPEAPPTRLVVAAVERRRDDPSLDGLEIALENLVAAGRLAPIAVTRWQPLDRYDGGGAQTVAEMTLDTELADRIRAKRGERNPVRLALEFEPQDRIAFDVGGALVVELLRSDPSAFGSLVVEAPSEDALARFEDLGEVDLTGVRVFVARGNGREHEATLSASEAAVERAESLAAWFEARGASVTRLFSGSDFDARLVANHAAEIFGAFE